MPDSKYPKYFTTFDLLKILGIKRERLKHWIEEGYIKAYLQEETPNGNKSYFDIWHVYNIKLFMYLLEGGLSRQEAAKWSQANSPEMIKDLKGTRQFKPDFLIFKKKGGEIIEATYEYDRNEIHVRLDEDFDDIRIIDFRKIVDTVDRSVAKNFG
jgi:hypothetical protein